MDTLIDPTLYGILASVLAMVTASLVWPDDSYQEFVKHTTHAR
jgi:hypothetical protein